MPTCTRRRFLALAAVASTAPLVLTRAGAARTASVNEQIGIGFIGMGIRGRNLLNRYFKSNDRTRVLAVCDVDTTRREHFRDAVNAHTGSNDCDAYNNYHDLLSRSDIDAVVIATPDHWHTLQSCHAAQAGKDVYCEKPLTHSLEESRVIIEVVGRTGRVFQTGSQQRSEFNGDFARACELVRAGAIGKLISINVGVSDPPVACDLPSEPTEPGLDWDAWLGPAPSRPYHSDLSPRGLINHYPAWRLYREYAGGKLADMGAHHYDIAQWAIGADTSGPFEVVPPMDDSSLRGARLRFDSGVEIHHGGPTGTTFVGETGMIHVDRGRLVSVPGSVLETEVREEHALARQPDHVSNWLECIVSRETPNAGVEPGARTAALCHLVNLAYRLRRPLRWDWATWRFLDDEEANGLLDNPRRPGFDLPYVG